MITVLALEVQSTAQQCIPWIHGGGWAATETMFVVVSEFGLKPPLALVSESTVMRGYLS